MSAIAIRRDGDDGLVARDATQADKRHKPDRSSTKKDREEEQGGGHAAQLGCSHAGNYKWRAEIQAGKKAQRRRAGDAAMLLFTDIHQFRIRAGLSAMAPGRICVPKQHAGEQHIDHAHHQQARRRQQRGQGAKFPGHNGKEQVSQKARREKGGEIADLGPQPRVLGKHRGNQHGSASCDAGRSRRQPQGQRFAEDRGRNHARILAVVPCFRM